MTTKSIMNGFSKALSSLGAFALVLAAAGCADQPKNRCKVAPGLAIARYMRKGTPTGTCTNVILPAKAESVGMQPFVPNPTGANAPNEATSFAIKPAWLGERIAEARDHAVQDAALKDMTDALVNYPYGKAADVPPPTDLKTTRRPYAFGKFQTVFPDDHGICKAANVNPSELVYPLIPAHKYPDPDDPTKTISVEEQPETAVKYAWSNVRVIQIPSSPGTQTFADLTVTRDGCSASYEVAILVPRVSCGVTDKDGKTTADAKACEANADPSPNSTNPFGSGISQGVKPSCEDISSDPAKPEQNDPMHPDFVCVPTKTAP
jgi:hypothetical protein